MGVELRNTLSQKAHGGTELQALELQKRLSPELLDQCQIFATRVEAPLDETKIRLLWVHDLPRDPSLDHIKNGGWKKFHKIIFVSNWQMQRFIEQYGIPWEHCLVLPNAINPIEYHTKPNDIIRLAYWSTPHRGLNILVPVFKKLCEVFDNIELDVYSSFNLYGWGGKDKPFEPLFNECRDHPKINYHGSVSNDIIRKNIKNTHIFAYPSTWAETSCICLIEAMSGGLVCVHPNYGALYETASNWTNMYQWTEDQSQHASYFYAALHATISNYNASPQAIQSQLMSQKSYTDIFYNWDSRILQWEHVIRSLLNQPRKIGGNDFFQYES